jgi:hypothetical protein
MSDRVTSLRFQASLKSLAFGKTDIIGLLESLAPLVAVK